VSDDKQQLTVPPKRQRPVPSHSSLNGGADNEIVKIRRTDRDCTLEARTGKFLWLCQVRKCNSNPCKTLLSSNRAGSNPQSTSRMLIVILIIFVGVEFLNGGFELLYIYTVSAKNSSESSLTKFFHDYKDLGRYVCNLVVLWSYVFNFFIFWLMSAQFRATLLATFRRTQTPGLSMDVSRRISRPEIVIQQQQQKLPFIAKTLSSALSRESYSNDKFNASTKTETPESPAVAYTCSPDETKRPKSSAL
ncbi:hypothetical protein Ciccas_007487, partial [Cichlidogyrus casuarinus]